MKRLMRILPIAVVFFTVDISTTASHVSGVDITYECVGQDSFMVNAKFYRNCTGINPPTQVNIDISGCGNSQITLPLINPGGTEVSQLCATWIDSSTCNLGGFPGYQRYDYEDIVVLQPCSLWTFSYSTNARSATTNIQTQTTIYIDAQMNSQFDACNNSPKFTTREVPYVCLNQTTSLEFGVEEADCDSLHFSMISARSAPATNNTYVAPYSPVIPIEAGFVLDPVTGTMTFTPNQIGRYIVVLKCEEFDRATQTLKGHVTKETTVVARICDNSLPYDTSGYITNFSTTGGQQIGPYEITLCQGQSTSFDMCIYDPELSDSISLTTNVLTALPGATWSYTPGNPACGTISWTATQGVCPSKSFFITASDNHCPMMGLQTYAYTINVLPTTYAGQDKAICLGDSALVEVFGGTQFNWTVIAGPPINVGTNFSCDTCASAWASPDSTTTYVISTDVTGICNSIDTITITVNDIPSPVGPITGPLWAQKFTTQTYSAAQDAGHNFNWTVSNASLMNGQGTNVIDVYFDTTGVPTICVTKTNITTGCGTDMECIQVDVAPVSVSETNLSDQFTIYPNPTTGQFTVQGATGTIAIYDLFGRLVKPITNPTTGSGSATQIDMSHQPKGVYIVRVGEAVRKLVVQ